MGSQIRTGFSSAFTQLIDLMPIAPLRVNYVTVFTFYPHKNALNTQIANLLVESITKSYSTSGMPSAFAASMSC